MKTLRFIGAANFTFYHDTPEDWRVGVEREIDDSKAEYLLKSFPGIWEPVDSFAPDKPKTTAKELKPTAARVTKEGK